MAMAGESLPSAVAIPEPAPVAVPEPVASPDEGLKRRNSSVSEAGAKRRRLSIQDARDRHSPISPRDTRQSPPNLRSVLPERRLGRERGNGLVEERKRGQRLFGALLGTLSQSSSTAAQKRRTDIEQRQQAKLKMQDEEYGELKRKKRDELVAVWKSQQRTLEKESMAVRHANLFAMAQFLKTKTEPVLYYRPWQLRDSEEDTIDQRIEEVEDLIAKEKDEFDERYPPEEGDPKPPAHENRDVTDNRGTQPTPEKEGESKETDGKTPKPTSTVVSTNQDVQGAEGPPEPASTTNDHNVADSARPEVSRPHEDDGGEVVEEDKEDTVIY